MNNVRINIHIPVNRTVRYGEFDGKISNKLCDRVYVQLVDVVTIGLIPTNGKRDIIA